MHATFFALRTAALPFDAWLDFGAELSASNASNDRLAEALDVDRRRLRKRLAALVERPEIREAIFVASPSLEASLDGWIAEPADSRHAKAERSIVRYFARMAGRSTPFGLFAGCSVGAIGDKTQLAIPPRSQFQRHTRLDTEYTLALAEGLTQDPLLRRVIAFRPNTTLYRAAGQVRFAESRFAGGQRSHHLVAVDDSPYLSATLERARHGATLPTLAQALVDEDVTLAEATDFVDELVDSQILVSDLQPTVTGAEPLRAIIGNLESLPDATGLADRLRRLASDVQSLDDSTIESSPNRYRQIAETLADLPAKFELPRLFQIDLFKPAPHATLDTRVVAELERAVDALARITELPTETSLSRFRAAFAERYGDREVPLVEALDEEAGIGFDRSTAPAADATALLAGLPFHQKFAYVQRWQARHAVLLDKLLAVTAAGGTELALTDADIDAMSVDQPAPLPNALAVMATVAARSPEAMHAGDYQLAFHHAGGPSGARMLGRFCHGDRELSSRVTEHLAAEEAHQPDAIFAEVVHLPEGRIGNVLLRPVLRSHEIAFLGASGAPEERRIGVDDLRVAVVGDRVMLRSASLGREVIPRLTNAHNYSFNALGVYKFLCELQGQGVASGLMWDWGPLESAPFLPRVRHGRVVFARARWLLTQAEIKSLAAAHDAELFAAVSALRERRRLPRFVVLRDGDNELPVDLDNILSIEALVDVIKSRDSAVLVEMFPGPDELCAAGPEGRFVHEIVVPMVRPAVDAPKPIADKQSTIRNPQSAIATSLAPDPSPTRREGEATRRFGPGSEWLYLKVYVGSATADRILRDYLRPVIERAVDAGLCDQWFFLRYNDPEWHLRVRFHGRPERLWGELLPALESALAVPLAENWVWRIQLDTYEREVERYGGDEGVALAEELFCADSNAALAIVDTCTGDLGLDARWRLAVRGIDRLLDDLRLDASAKRRVIRAARDGFAAEFGVESNFKQALGQKFREQRRALESLLDPSADAGSPFGPGLDALARRGEQLAPVVERLRDAETGGRLTQSLESLAASYVHMWINRVIRSAQRAHELVFYDFLDRVYESAAARERKKVPVRSTT